MKKSLFALPLILALAACANTGADYRPIVDGPEDAKFERDLAACQALARKKDYLSGENATNAAVGAGLGAIVGGLTGDWAGAGIGAGVGLGAGAAKGAVDTQSQRANIVKKCIEKRGHNVVE